MVPNAPADWNDIAGISAGLAESQHHSKGNRSEYHSLQQFVVPQMLRYPVLLDVMSGLVPEQAQCQPVPKHPLHHRQRMEPQVQMHLCRSCLLAAATSNVTHHHLLMSAKKQRLSAVYQKQMTGYSGHVARSANHLLVALLLPQQVPTSLLRHYHSWKLVLPGKVAKPGPDLHPAAPVCAQVIAVREQQQMMPQHRPKRAALFLLPPPKEKENWPAD
jgi:hypothetical protein